VRGRPRPWERVPAAVETETNLHFQRFLAEEVLLITFDGRRIVQQCIFVYHPHHHHHYPIISRRYSCVVSSPEVGHRQLPGLLFLLAKNLTSCDKRATLTRPISHHPIRVSLSSSGGSSSTASPHIHSLLFPSDFFRHLISSLYYQFLSSPFPFHQSQYHYPPIPHPPSNIAWRSNRVLSSSPPWTSGRLPVLRTRASVVFAGVTHTHIRSVRFPFSLAPPTAHEKYSCPRPWSFPSPFSQILLTFLLSADWLA
jgi:hypothetical protein